MVVVRGQSRAGQVGLVRTREWMHLAERGILALLYIGH